ncbi:MAG TPA: glutaredoxin family protein [Bacillota bacterium]|nr:glutaredoxin family protein [Bacillota bacterium]
MRRVIFYTKDDCLLCEEALILLEMYENVYNYTIEIRDIETNDEWLDAHFLAIPVVEVNDETLMSDKVTSHSLDALFQKHFSLSKE